jgi:hypothetical protein
MSVFEQKSDFFRSKKGRDALRQGNVPGYHLLKNVDVEGFETEVHLAVDFRSTYGVPYEFLRDFAKKMNRRLRLLPSYGEHLSQAFARFSMRVG